MYTYKQGKKNASEKKKKNQFKVGVVMKITFHKEWNNELAYIFTNVNTRVAQCLMSGSRRPPARFTVKVRTD